MSSIRRILFAVRNPDAPRQPGINKAIQIAASLGASLELFHALTSPVFLQLQPMTGDSIETLRARTVEHVRKRLAKFVAPARKRGVALDYSVEWDYPPHEAIVRRAGKSGADLIIAECHRGTRTRAWLIHLTDWELLRTSPLPVLLLRNGRPYRRPLTLAAVDPGHTHAKPLDLDTRIVGMAKQFSAAFRGALHLVHANHPPTLALALGDPGLNAASIALTYDELTKHERASFEKFAATTGIARARAHMVDGHPAMVIPRSARKLGAGLVVMGAVSRSGLKRVFIGNTAERVLNALPCDVLVVKPEAFETHVERVPRGMRLIAQPPIAPLVS